MKVAIYTRVSTSMQADKDSLPTQRAELTYYAKLVLGIDDYVIFEDAGFSAKDTFRPEFQKMFERIRAGEFTHVLVWKIDRFSRSLLDFCNLYQELRDLGVTFVSKNERFDTSSAIGEAVLRIILVFAELERKLTSERVAAVTAFRASEGKYNGGSLPLGYIYDKETREISIDPDTADVVRSIFEAFVEKKELLTVAQEVNKSGKLQNRLDATAVSRLIRNPYYIGIKRYTAQGEKRYAPSTDGHELFIDEDLWHKANEIVENISVHHEPKHMLPEKYIGKKLYCAVCGKRMTIYPIIRAKTYIYYTCNNRACTMHNRTISEYRLLPVLLQILLNLVFAQESLKLSTPLEVFSKRITSGRLLKDYEITPESAENIYSLLKENRIKPYYYDPPEDSFAKKSAAILAKIQHQEEKLKSLLKAYDLNNDSELEAYKRASAIVESNISKLNEDLHTMEAAHRAKYKYNFTFEKLYSMRTSLPGINIREYFPPKDVAAFIDATVSKICVVPTRITSITLKNNISVSFNEK